LSRLKYHENPEVDELITVVFTEDYKLRHFYKTPWPVALRMIRRNKSGDVIYWDWQKDYEINFKDLPNQNLVAVFQ
jgi:hypothetical protein